MKITQQFIVFLWLVPILGFIVLPLFWSIFGMLFRVVERTRLRDVQGFVELNNRGAGGSVEFEQRSRPRILIDGGRACIDQESKCCKAYVSDVSGHGICLRDIPQKKYLDTGYFRVVVRTRQRDYNLMVRPVWKKLTENGYLVGAEIKRIPAEWRDLVERLTSSLAPAPA